VALPCMESMETKGRLNLKAAGINGAS